MSAVADGAGGQELLAAIGHLAASLTDDQRATAEGLLQWWWEWADTQWPVQELAARAALLQTLREPPPKRCTRKSSQRRSTTTRCADVPAASRPASTTVLAALQDPDVDWARVLTELLRAGEANNLERMRLAKVRLREAEEMLREQQEIKDAIDRAAAQADRRRREHRQGGTAHGG